MGRFVFDWETVFSLTYVITFAIILAIRIPDFPSWWFPSRAHYCIAVLVCAVKDGEARVYPDPCAAEADGAREIETDIDACELRP